MTSDSLIEVVQEAGGQNWHEPGPCNRLDQAAERQRPGYVSRAFRDYLDMVGIMHILASPDLTP